MKKKLTYILLIIVFLLLILFIKDYVVNYNQNLQVYLYMINKEIREKDFDFAKVRKNEVLLYKDNNLIKEIKIDYKGYKYDVEKVTKDSNRVFYKMKNDKNVIFDNNKEIDFSEINKVDFIGGNSYYSSNKENLEFVDLSIIKQVYNIIQNEDFFVGEIGRNLLILKDKDFNIIKKIQFKRNSYQKKNYRIVKDDKNVLFIITGAVDDEIGVFYDNDNRVKRHGWHMKKLENNWYYYSTWY